MRQLLCIVLLGLLLPACGQGGPSIGQPLPTSQPAPTSAGLPPTPVTAAPTSAPTSAPTAVPAPTGEQATEEQPAAEFVDEARMRLARQLGIEATALTLKSATAQNWSDGSLGCPAPDQLYPQVITPGYQIIFSDGARDYAVHTDKSEGYMILCDNDQPAELPPAEGSDSTPGQAVAQPNPALEDQGPGSQALIDRAKQMLSADIGVPVDQITTVTIEAAEWRDSSLGCPQPGMSYLQVITPGYKITLEAQGKHYTYHTDTQRRAIRCDKPAIGMRKSSAI